VDKSFAITKIGRHVVSILRACGVSRGMRQRNEPEDQDLVARCLAGSEDAWNEFYGRFAGLVRVVVRKYVRPGTVDVEDMSQSAFIAVASALKSYDGEQSLPKFISLIAQRAAIDEYRKTRAAKRSGEVNLDLDSVEDATTTLEEAPELQDERLDKARLAQRLRSALNELEPRCRDLITLRYFRELSFKEIGESFGVTENTATVQTRRCLESLREKFNRVRRRGSLSP